MVSSLDINGVTIGIASKALTSIVDLQDGNAGAWIFLGDFNSILGGRLPIQAVCS